MSTDFTIYALDAEDVPKAKAYAASSLGYGNTDMTSIMVAAGHPSRMDIFETVHGRFTVDHDHTTFHDDSEPCLAHDMVDLIGHDFPRLVEYNADGEHAVFVAALMELWNEHHKATTKTGKALWDMERARFAAFLQGALGRRLWYVFE